MKLRALVVSIALIATGCGTSPAIKSAQEFHKLEAQFKSDTNSIADDIYNSCLRRVGFIQTDTARSNEARKEAFKQCEDLNKPASLQARDANKVVVDYITAIGKLAADDVVSFEDEFSQLKESLVNFSIPQPDGTAISLPENAVSTGTKIANFLFGWATNEYREGKLKEAIICSNKPFQTYLNGLKSALQDGYIDGILAQELFRVNSYYDFYAALQRNSSSTSEEEYRSLQRESYEAIRETLSQRNAALSYLEIIDRTATAHSELAKIFLDGEEAPSDSFCEATFFARQNAPSSKTATSGVVSQDLTLQEFIQVQEVLQQYQKEVALLLFDMQQELTK